MIHLLKLAVLPALLLLVKADLPIDTEVPIFSRNDEDVFSYRIPESLDPIHYDVEITPYFEATADKEAFSFDGIVTMTMRAVEADLTEIILQDNVRTISALTVMDANGVPLLLNETLPIERIRQYQILKINLRDGVVLENGATYIIRILYVGHMNETPLSRGMFRGSYVGADGTTHWYAATHLQPTHGRQLFPCLDEPGFKSTFTIIVNRLPSYNGTFSNMHLLESVNVGDRVRDTFITTPRMSAYLVTIHISEEFEVIADNNNSERSYRIIARPTARGQGEYALEVGPPLTEWLENYLGVPYYGMGEDMKNDQLASPYWASGATENWGLVTYRELRLLYEEGETNDMDKMTVATITAHELAHKWFGNLVTARWWDNVWINEGYASYFEYFAMDAVDPTLELDDQFNIMYLQSSLSADSAVGTRALQHTVNSPAEVTGHFSGISYTKGASLLNMLKHFLTEETFRKALEYYLVDMSYEHAYPEDVYRGFERAVQEDGVLSAFSNVNITDFLNYWVDEPGYPIVNVNYDVSSGLISLEQERFFISPTAAQTEQVWIIPITYTTEGNPDWDQTRATHVMTEGTLDIQKDAVEEWVIFNVKQNGIYRVNYNEHNWHLIAAALKEDINSIHYLNRAQIVDDIFALMRSGRMTYALGFHVLDFLKSETNYIVWYPAITGLSWLRNRFLHLEGTLQEFENIILGFLETVVADLGLNQGADDSLTRNLNRLYVLAFACNVGHPDCISDALDKFNGLYSNGVSVTPNLRRHVYCHGLRLGGYEEWSFLHQLRLSGNNQANDVVMLRGLGCTNNEQAVQQYLETILTPDVKAQDRVNAFTFLFMGGRSNTRLALEFIKERHNEIREAVVASSWFSSILANMAAYMDEEGLQAMEDWLNAEQANIPEYAVGISSINSARASMQWGDNNADEVLAAVRDSATVAVPASLLLAMSLLVLMMQ